MAFTLALAGRDRDALDDAREGYQRARQLGLEHAAGSYVAYNLAWQLLAAGHWAECERFTAELLAGDSWAAHDLHAIRGQLLGRRGDFAAAHEHLDQARRVSSPAATPPGWGGPSWPYGRATTRRRAPQSPRGCAGMPRLAARRDSPQHSSPWYALALRLAADQAERAAARRAADELAEIRRRAAPIAGANWTGSPACTAPDARHPGVLCNLLLAQAERSRLEGASDPERWQAAAAAWERLERPFEAAYARFRQAEALLAGGAPRQQAETALRQPTRRRSRSGRRRCGVRSSCSPSAAASASRNQSTRPRQPRGRLRRPPRSA